MKIVRLDTGADWDQTTVTEEVADDLDLAIAELEQLKTARDKAIKRYKDVEARILELLDERQEKTHYSPFDGGWQVTKVVGERVTIDEERLESRLGERMWDHVTKRVFDRAKLEHCVSLGLVSGDDVAECASIQQNSPYLRLTRHREQESEEHHPGAD